MSPKKSQICRDIVERISQIVPTSPNGDQGFGLQNGVAGRRREAPLGPGASSPENTPGPLHVAVPALRGPTSAQARRSLADAGLLGDSRKTRSATFAAGHVAHQEPKAGGTLTRGQTAKYWVSAGLPLVEVPDVVGLSSGDGGRRARRPAARLAFAAASTSARRSSGSRRWRFSHGA